MVNDNYNRCIEATRVLASPRKNLGWNVELSRSQISGRQDCARKWAVNQERQLRMRTSDELGSILGLTMVDQERAKPEHWVQRQTKVKQGLSSEQASKTKWLGIGEANNISPVGTWACGSYSQGIRCPLRQSSSGWVYKKCQVVGPNSRLWVSISGVGPRYMHFNMSLGGWFLSSLQMRSTDQGTYT